MDPLSLVSNVAATSSTKSPLESIVHQHDPKTSRSNTSSNKKKKKKKMEVDEEVKLPVNNFLLIKKVVDDHDTGGLTLVGTFVQTVFGIQEDDNGDDSSDDDDKEKFRFQYRFGDETETDDSVQLRRQEPVTTTRLVRTSATVLDAAAVVHGRRSTFQTKIPLQMETLLQAFPFHILTATADIELSSTFHNGTRYRPDLVVSRSDRRGNMCLQDLKTPNPTTTTTLTIMGSRGGGVSESDILDKIDKTVQYDFVSPYPTVQYEFDIKKQYCPRYTVTFYCIKGGFTKFVAIILPIIPIAVINTINVLNDTVDFGDGPVDTTDHLGISSALILTAVFLLPSIIEPNTRQALMRLDNFYILVIFISLMLSSFPQNLTGTPTVEVIGMVGLWVSFISPIFNCARFVQFLLQTRAEKNAIVAAGAESNPYLKDDDYTPWKPNKEPYDAYFCTVNSIVNDMDTATRAKLGYAKNNELMGKFEIVKYN